MPIATISRNDPIVIHRMNKDDRYGLVVLNGVQLVEITDNKSNVILYEQVKSPNSLLFFNNRRYRGSPSYFGVNVFLSSDPDNIMKNQNIRYFDLRLDRPPSPIIFKTDYICLDEDNPNLCLSINSDMVFKIRYNVSAIRR